MSTGDGTPLYPVLWLLPRAAGLRSILQLPKACQLRKFPPINSINYQSEPLSLVFPRPLLIEVDFFGLGLCVLTDFNIYIWWCTGRGHNHSVHNRDRYPWAGVLRPPAAFLPTFVSLAADTTGGLFAMPSTISPVILRAQLFLCILCLLWDPFS